MSTVDNPLRSVTTLWWLVLLFGIAALGVGIFFVASPHETLKTFTVIAGIFLVVDGVLALAQRFAVPRPLRARAAATAAR